MKSTPFGPSTLRSNVVFAALRLGTFSKTICVILFAWIVLLDQGGSYFSTAVYKLYMRIEKYGLT